MSELWKIVKERSCGIGVEPNYPHNSSIRVSYIGDMRIRKTNCAISLKVDELSLQPAIKEAISLLRRHCLSYEQILYVIQSARKAGGLDRPTIPKKLRNEVCRQKRLRNCSRPSESQERWVSSHQTLPFGRALWLTRAKPSRSILFKWPEPLLR